METVEPAKEAEGQMSFSDALQGECFLCGGPQNNLIFNARANTNFMCHATEFYVNGRYSRGECEKDVDAQWIIPVCGFCFDPCPGPSPEEAIVEHRVHEKLQRLYPGVRFT